LASMASPWRVVEEDETPGAGPSRSIEAPYQVVDDLYRNSGERESSKGNSDV
jgi:hypothetical protein